MKLSFHESAGVYAGDSTRILWKGNLGVILVSTGAILTFLVVVFMVLFPKGGIRVGGLPVTWGCCFIALAGGLSALGAILRQRLPFLRRWFFLYLLIVPIQLVAIGTWLFLGYLDTGTMVGTATSLFVFPMIFIFCLGHYFDTTTYLPLLLTTLRWCVFLAALYGLCLFTYRSATGAFFEVPYVTTNGSESGALEKKNNSRGDIRKLTSTYNNGNIYGVCTLILLPLYSILEKSAWRKIVVKAAIILTLSRTVWLGLMLSEVLCLFFLERKNAIRALRSLVLMVVAVGGIFGALAFMGKGASWIVDQRLGGRNTQLEVIKDFTFLPEAPFYEIGEIVYLCFLREFGVVGLVALLPFLAAPLVGYMTMRNPGLIRRACALGVMLYIFLAASDGVFMLIPSMALFWFLCTLIWCQNSALLPSSPAGQ